MSREYRFDRYRKGRKMAEGLVLTHPKTVDDAVAVASRLAEAGDVFVLREDLACLAAVEAERDAARATYTCFHCGFASADEAEATAHFGDRDEEMALCQWWKDSTDTERVQALQDAIEEQNAARAGEARAVEALRRCHEGAARQLAEPRDHDDDQYALTAIATDCEAALADSANALDWLAQQRREAAAEALEKLATDLRQDQWESALHDVDSLRGILRTRAAAIGAGEAGNE